jgi:hypothetical protein
MMDTGSMATKVTLPVDGPTVSRPEDAANPLALSEAERLRMLRIFDESMTRIPRRPVSDADRELREIRRDHQSGGRRRASGAD